MDTAKTRKRKDPADTRRRIVQATVALHEDVGPANTTISAIAQRAGVQRLTVYRHFPDEQSLLAACSSHWIGEHPFPDPAQWAGLGDPGKRLAAALRTLYAYYRDEERMLARTLRDEPEVPALAEVMVPFHSYLREIAASLATGWGVAAEAQRLVRAAVGHSVRFETYRSLAAQGLSVQEAAELMTVFVSDLAARDR
ncbi:MAG: TetR/AcrR family transcriptional regulator [Gemmatimonadales bacterium]|jgi:AcrR family transcriptional regulator